MSARRVSRSRSSAQAQPAEPAPPSSPSPSSPAASGSSPASSAEVTRCICGHDELHLPDRRHLPAYLPANSPFLANPESIDSGLFIQCETCDVWQHGFCVGFYQESAVPDAYYCEKCRSDLHVVVVRPSGKTSTYVGSEDNREEIEMVLKHGVAAVADEEESRETPELAVKVETIERKANDAKSSNEREVGIMDDKVQSQSQSQSATTATTTTTTATTTTATTTTATTNNIESDEHPELKPENEDDDKNTISTGRSVRSSRSTLNSRSGDAAYEETLRRVLEESVNDKKHISDESDSKHSDSRKSQAENPGDDDKEERRDGEALSSSSSSSRSSRSKKRQALNNYTSYDEDTNTNEPTTVTAPVITPSLSTQSKRKRRVPNGNGSNQELTGDEDTSNNTDTGFKTTTTSKRRRPDDTNNGTTTTTSTTTTATTTATTANPPTSSKGKGGGSRSSKSKPEDYVNDKPSKPRIPGSRSQLNDMKKRVAAILEFIGRTQVEMAQENNEDKRGSYDINNNTPQEGPLFESSKSLQMMDALTRKLLLWEQKFGRYGKN